MFNDPPLYDRYNYGIHHASDDELTEWGGYANVSLDRVPFDQHIYRHLRYALGDWSNQRCGEDQSPLSQVDAKNGPSRPWASAVMNSPPTT